MINILIFLIFWVFFHSLLFILLALIVHSKIADEAEKFLSQYF